MLNDVFFHVTAVLSGTCNRAGRKQNSAHVAEALTILTTFGGGGLAPPIAKATPVPATSIANSSTNRRPSFRIAPPPCPVGSCDRAGPRAPREYTVGTAEWFRSVRQADRDP